MEVAINARTGKENMGHTHNEIFLSLRKEGHLVICDSADGVKGYFKMK